MADAQEQEELRAERIHDAISEQIVDIVTRIAETEGAHKVTVRKIISELNVTNRVFYNRFSNCDEVLRIVYRRAVMQIRENITPDLTDQESFVRSCIDAAVDVLKKTYSIKMQFRRYVFEHDSLTEENRLWWAEKIRQFYQIAVAQGYAKEVDADAFCYAVWCFCRGYFADVVSRQLTQEDAIRYFTFGFTCLINGVLK